MIGFVSAISSALAVIILVVISSLLAFVQAIMPESGIIKINETKYRYVMDSSYVDAPLIREVIVELGNAGISERVISYQIGCNYGFNADERQMTEISTFNYIALGHYFAGSIPIEPINIYEEKQVFNTCFVDINLSPLKKKQKENK